MAIDTLFTNGIIAAKEKYLLGDKIYRMCEVGADEAFRMLLESGFGGGEYESVHDYDRAVFDDERAIDEFVREYAPTNAELAYLLAPRDFHNAKAILKAQKLEVSPDKMLAPDGNIPISSLLKAATGDFSDLSGDEGCAIATAISLCKQALEEDCSGAEVGIIFEREKFSYLLKACKKNKLLKELITTKIDMTNILTALRAADEKGLSNGYIPGGKLSISSLTPLFSDLDKVEADIFGQELKPFLKLCLAEKKQGLPLTQAEKMKDSIDFLSLNERRFELYKSQPFLFYVFRRRLENENVRIVFVCLLCDMKDREIKARLRGCV
jgi:vacuolar-type H+-ATPase subunit C/Vma6